MEQNTVANQCPFCKALIGNWYVYEDDDMIARAYNEFQITVEREFEV